MEEIDLLNWYERNSKPFKGLGTVVTWHTVFMLALSRHWEHRVLGQNVCEKYLSYSADMSKQYSSKGELSNQFSCNKYSNMNDGFQSTVHTSLCLYLGLTEAHWWRNANKGKMLWAVITPIHGLAQCPKHLCIWELGQNVLSVCTGHHGREGHLS